MQRGAASERERGDVVLGWLTRVVVVLALIAVVAFDLIAVVSSRVSVTDDANAAAEAANYSWNDKVGNLQAAYEAAVGYADAHNETLVANSFSIAKNGTVHLTLRAKATTLLMGKIGPLKKFAETTGKGSATTPAN
jgi:hypothetical protein